MIKRDVNRILFLIALLLTVASCSTRKSVALLSPDDKAAAQVVASSPAAVSIVENLSGSVKLAADVAGKSFSSSGTVRIKSGEGVQIGIVPLGLFEVACLEFLPLNLRFINKLEKEYADVPYVSVDFLQKSGIDYSMLESVLLNRIFIPGRGAGNVETDFSYSVTPEHVVATTGEIDGIVYTFTVERATGNLVTTVGKHSSGATVTCTYGNFASLDGRPFPNTVSLVLGGVGKPASLTFRFSGLKTKNVSLTQRKVSSYDKIPVGDIVDALGKMQ